MGSYSHHFDPSQKDKNMTLPLQITFHRVQHSDAVALAIGKKVEKLQKFCNRIISCRVTVDAPHQRHNQGNIYRVVVDISLPGHEIVIGRDPEKDHSHEDVYVAIRDSFAAAQRCLQNYRQRLSKDRRQESQTSPHGRVVRLADNDGGFGFIQTHDGREIYFHENSVLAGHFGDLEVGMEVRFTEEEGEKGPQASTVDLVGRDNRRIA
jgi:cold shock CspA family protein/ribosome-associated translation inhibitor RaiA